MSPRKELQVETYGSPNESKNSAPLLGQQEFVLETDEERRTRKYSLWIMYFTTFLQSVGGSIVVTGMWPYLQQLDKNTDKEWFGWVVAANPLGQLISSPLIGWVCNRLEATRSPSIVCIILFIVSNCWYAVLPLHTVGASWYILVARFLVGISSGSITACRTFVTQGTLLAERTASISHLSLSQALGFVLGPVGQLALKPLGREGFVIGSRLPVNMYTAVGWLTATLGLINLIFFHPKFFHESDIAIREAQGKAKISSRYGDISTTYNTDQGKIAMDIKPDYVGVMSIVFTFFIVFFNFVLLETLGTPVSIDQFGWSDEKAITVVGLTMIISSVVSTSLFFLIPILAKVLDERVLLIGFGIVPMIIGRVFFFPFADKTAPMRRFGCLTTTGAEVLMDDDVCMQEGHKWVIIDHGCPPSQEWCQTIPALDPIVVAIGYAICTLGFPFCIALSQTIFSKIIGPRPQGLWMGGLTSVSSLSRVIGPIFVTYIYTNYGTYVTSGTALGLMVLILIVLLAVYKRLVPLVVPGGKVPSAVDP